MAVRKRRQRTAAATTNLHPCEITEERILTSYERYGARMGTNAGRGGSLSIDYERVQHLGPNELWRLWVLANLYQRVREQVSEDRFNELTRDPESRYLFSPKRLDQLASARGCSHLSLWQTVYECDYRNKKDTCAFQQHKNTCVVKRVCQSLARHPAYPRIACTLVASSKFLRQYDYSFDRLRQQTVCDRDGSQILKTLKEMSGLKAGDKIPRLFLVWLSNPIEYGVWDIDYSDFIPIDLNVRRVAGRASGCTNDDDVRGHVQELATQWELNVREVELAFLNVGQEYCHKQNPLCEDCTFGTTHGSDDVEPDSGLVHSITIKDTLGNTTIAPQAQWDQLRDRLDAAVKAALCDGEEVEIL